MRPWQTTVVLLWCARGARWVRELCKWTSDGGGRGRGRGCGQLEMARVGAGATSACVVGTESTACARTVGGTGLTGGIHGPAREGTRTGGQR
jgi:hypothetical protein